MSDGFVVDIPVNRSGRRKVPVGTGCSLTDWIGLARSAKKPAPRTFAREEIEQHNRENDLWMVIAGKVYDVTLFAKYHPGGEGVLMTCAGKDATVMYNKYHPWVQAEAMMGPFCLGTYDPKKAYDAPPPYPGIAPPTPAPPAGGAQLPSAPASSFSMSRPAPPGGQRIPWEKGQALTMDVVKQRCTTEELWVVIYGKVYDVTGFLKDHPGGGDILINSGGKDASSAFEKYHSAKAKEQLKDFYIGDVKSSPGSLLTPTSTAPPPRFGKQKGGGGGAGKYPSGPSASSSIASIEPETREMKVTSTASISHDSIRITLEPAEGAPPPAEIPLCGHIRLHTPAGDSRSYTPVRSGGGRLEFVIKKYPGGVLSSHVHSLLQGGQVAVSGPFQGRFRVPESGVAKYVLLAGGTGIAPFYPLIKSVVEKDASEAWVMYANKTPADALLSLEEFTRPAGSKVSVRHFWSEGIPEEGAEDTPLPQDAVGGRIDRAACEAFLPPPGEGVRALVCGPPSFNEALGAVLENLGYATTRLE